MVRSLQPHLVNLGKRLVKSPKVYGRDCGLLHALLKKVGIEIKFSVAPKPARGFWQSFKDLQISTAWVIAPAPRRYPLAPRVEVVCR